jgi:hypothetical protein
MKPSKIITVIAGVQVDEQECTSDNERSIINGKEKFFKISFLKDAGLGANIFLIKESRLNYGNYEDLDDKIFIE